MESLEGVLKLATEYGIWAGLSVFLIRWILKTNEKREAQYQKLLTTLAEKFDIVLHIKEDVDLIKDCLHCATETKPKKKVTKNV